MEDARIDYAIKHNCKEQQMDKVHMMKGQSCRADGPSDVTRPGLRTMTSNDSLKAQPSSPPCTPAQKPLKDQIYELRQYLKLLDQLEAWYSVGLAKIQKSTEEGGQSKSNLVLISPVEAEIYKTKRLKTRISFNLHAMCLAQQGSNNCGQPVSDIPPIKLSDLLQRKWDTPHLDRKVLHQILLSGGYEPKTESRVSSGLDLKPSDSDFLKLCDVIERQMKDLASVVGIKKTVTPPILPPPPRKASISSAPPTTSSPTQPPHLAVEGSESLAVGTHTPPAARKQQTPAPTTTNSPSRPPVKPVPPTPVDVIEAFESQLTELRKTFARISQKTETRTSQLENEPKCISKPDGQRGAEEKTVSMPKVMPESLRAKLKSSAPTVEDHFETVREAYMWPKTEVTAKPKPGLSKLRHELQAEPFKVVPDLAEPPVWAMAELTHSFFKPSPELQAEEKAGFKPFSSRGFRSAGRAELRVPVYQNSKPQPEAIRKLASHPQTETETTTKPTPAKPMRSALKSPALKPADSDPETGWETLPSPGSLTAFCECCGVEHEDFENLALENEELDFDSGVELEDEGGEEGGLLITNRDGQVVEDDDDGEELNVKGDYFLAKLHGIVKQTLEDRDAIAEWNDDFTEEAEEKEDGEYCVL